MPPIFNPISTYRIQFNRDFTFRDLKQVIPYLQSLGVRTVYASPVFEAAPGSTHGYDGTNPNSINPEIGSLEELTEIAGELRKRDISWLQDIVPNHLAYHENNAWLMDVLDKGRHSPHAAVFDINWDHHVYPGRVMVPFPGSTLEGVLKEKYPEAHNYVLCSWQETDYRINYRRFFLVNTLICTNIHVDAVFDQYHELIKKLTATNVFQGLRVDHVDGLRDPSKYLRDLRRLAGSKAYIIVEKILEPGEEMPQTWPVQGSSGYDFLGIINNLFTNRAAEYDLTAFYYDISHDGTPVQEQIREKKRLILTRYMGGELDNLTHLYREVTGMRDSDIPDEHLKSNIADYLVNCPIYRYYEEIPVMPMDTGRDKASLQRFYERCMQFTGPLMAKGVEDTLMYTYNRFIVHNEVGDSPELFGYTVQQFHRLMLDRCEKWPHSMNSTSTHDTKRGEDVRARLNVISDVHGEWIDLVRQWQNQNAALKTNSMPDDNDEYFIYQTLAGSYPVTPGGTLSEEERMTYRERIAEYLTKSLREAKVHSTWTENNSEYEAAAINFAHRLIDDTGTFSATFKPLLRKITDYGMINSFAQLVLKFTCPGIPDVYQGTELWDLSLVDPDNRRAVDYRLRAAMLKDDRSCPSLWEDRRNGTIKLKLLHELQKIRSRYNDVFNEGTYTPLQVHGTYKENALAFTRHNRHVSILVVVPLHLATIHRYEENAPQAPSIDWKDTRVALPESTATLWTHLLSGAALPASGDLMLNDAFSEFPVAVLRG